MIITNLDLSRYVNAHRRLYEFGFTCGTFDWLHAGHVDYLRHAAALCSRLIVGVNTDASVARYKGHLPVVPWEQRAAAVDGIKGVWGVTPLEEDRPLALLRQLRPHLYIKGGDYRAIDLHSAPEGASWGGEVHIVPLRFDVSSSELKWRVRCT